MAAAQRNYAAIATKYARDAVADRKGQRFCKWVRLAAQRHLDDLKRQKKGNWPYRWDEWHANDICGFIEKLPHIEGTWKKVTIDLEPAQIFMLAVPFGWRNKKDGYRRFSRVYIELARKNAKSTLAAGVALYCLTCEGEVGPQVIIGATTGEQAQKVFKPARDMVKKTAKLRSAFRLVGGKKSVACHMNGGFIQTINAKSETQDGWNIHCGILDELHAHKTRGLFDVVRSAMGSRKNPLLWIITTAGYNVTGVCYEQRKLVAKVLEGVVKADHIFGIIYTLDEGDNEYDEKNWGKANPMLGKSVTLKDLRSYAIEAESSPDSHGEFLTKRLNVWTRAAKSHVNVRKWLKCNGEVELGDLLNVPCWGGLDFANVTDMNAFRLVWRMPDETVKTWGRFYLPEETIRPRTERGNVPYQTWHKLGLLVATPGEVTDFDWIIRDIKWALATFKIQGIAYDPWGPARPLANGLLADGAPMIEFRQGIASYNGPMKELDRLYLKGDLAHGGDEILAWNASNVVARKDVNDNTAPDKSKSEEKIDGYVALLMALGIMLTETEETQGFTASHGVLRLGA